VQRDPAARRYAQAALELAIEGNSLDVWERDMRSLGAALASEQAVGFVGSRQISSEAKEDFLRRAAGDISPLAWNLVRLLSAKHRLSLLPQIAEAFQEFADERRGIAHAQVVTAVALSDDEERALAQRLSELTGKQVDVRLYQDDSILGGLVARIGDRLIDGSTKTKLIALKRRLAGAAR
jgi:F-type H+-transporting ATPase subunit delta